MCKKKQKQTKQTETYLVPLFLDLKQTTKIIMSYNFLGSPDL